MPPVIDLAAEALPEILMGGKLWRVVDVRSPGEFALDHFPGAINLPVLADEERHDIGSEYVQGSAFEARRRGAALVVRAIADHLDQAPVLKNVDSPLLVMCARGGQRSVAFAHILGEIGFPVHRLLGGYKAFRRLVRDTLQTPPPLKALVVYGPSGCDKTLLLPRVAARLHLGWIDLEGCAGHRGSRFGGLGRQPRRQRGFENQLWAACLQAESGKRPILLEGESLRIGSCYIPKPFWQWMQEASRIWINLPREQRARNLVHDYFGSDPQQEQVAAFIALLESFTSQLSRARVQELINLLQAGKTVRVAEILLAEHFDPHYDKHRAAGGNAEPLIEASHIDELEDKLITRLATLL